MKTCKKCGELKKNSEFNKVRKNKDGLHSYCRICHNNVNREYLAKKSYKPVEIQFEKCEPIKPIKFCTDKDLIDELRRRGYTGKLTTQTQIEL